jgi:hypothetical protein
MKTFPWLAKLFRRKPDYGGVPRPGRQKTYSAESGYVYQYALSSFRQRRDAGDFVHEYTFTVTSGVMGMLRVTVALRASVLGAWEMARGRELSASERFGIAKIALKRAFDDASSPAALGNVIAPERAEVEEISEYLDL